MFFDDGFDFESDVNLFESYSIYMGAKYEKSILIKYWDVYHKQKRKDVAKIRKNNRAAGAYQRQGFKKLH